VSGAEIARSTDRQLALRFWPKDDKGGLKRPQPGPSAARRPMTEAEIRARFLAMVRMLGATKAQALKAWHKQQEAKARAKQEGKQT